MKFFMVLTLSVLSMVLCARGGQNLKCGVYPTSKTVKEECGDRGFFKLAGCNDSYRCFGSLGDNCYRDGFRINDDSAPCSKHLGLKCLPKGMAFSSTKFVCGFDNDIPYSENFIPRNLKQKKSMYDFLLNKMRYQPMYESNESTNDDVPEQLPTMNDIYN